MVANDLHVDQKVADDLTLKIGEKGDGCNNTGLEPPFAAECTTYGDQRPELYEMFKPILPK